MDTKIRIKKDDKVKILVGKDRDKIGKVLKVDRKDERILIEKINMVKRHSKPSAKNRQGGIVEMESPVHRSNVLLLCNKCLKPTRVKVQALEDGKRVRVCKKCNENIDS